MESVHRIGVDGQKGIKIKAMTRNIAGVCVCSIAPSTVQLTSQRAIDLFSLYVLFSQYRSFNNILENSPFKFHFFHIRRRRERSDDRKCVSCSRAIFDRKWHKYFVRKQITLVSSRPILDPTMSSSSLPRRRFYGSSSFIPPHKRLLNRKQHSFPKLSQSHCTFQILESWPWPQGNLIITRSALNTGKAFWPLINVRFRAAKIRFSQILEYSMHCITLAKERKEGKR